MARVNAAGEAPIAIPAGGRSRVARRLRPLLGVDRVLLIAMGAIVLTLVLAPLLFLVYTSLHVPGGEVFALTLANFTDVLTGSYGWQVVANSLIFAIGGSGMAIVLGTALAWLVERTDAPLRKTTYAVMFVSIALPGLFKVVGWIVLLGPRAGFINKASASLFGEGAVFDIFSMKGMVFVEALLWVPTAFLLMVAPLHQMDRTLEEAAQTSGARPLQVIRRVTFPLLAPGIAAVGLLALVRTLEAFEVPALIGLPGGKRVLTSVIFEKMTHGIVPSYEGPSAYAVLLMLPVSVGLILYLRMISKGKKYQVVTGKGFRPSIFELGRWRPVAGVALAGVCLLMLLPMFALMWTSFMPYVISPSVEALSSATWENYTGLLRFPRLRAATQNTAIVALVTAAVVMLLASVCSWVVVRSKLRSRFALDYLTMAPLVFPGIVLGLALMEVYLRIPIGVYNTLAIIIIALVTRFLPFGMRYASTGLLQIHNELEESAAVAGGNWRQVFGRVTLPLLLPALFAGWVFIFLNAATELSASVLLAGPKSQVLSVLLFELWQEGGVNQIGALSVAFSIPLVLVALALHRIAGKVGTHV